MTEDPYRVLGVPPGASIQQVTAAYRRLARIHHPDLHADCDERERRFHHERMASLTAAYHRLTDPREKERYRLYQRRRAPRTQDAAGGSDRVRFTTDTRQDAAAPAGDPDFDYRARASAEFDVGNAPRDRRGRTSRKGRGFRRRRRR